MKISEVYEKYKIMPQLQLHMLRVAGVANMICDSFDLEIDSGLITQACLLHDIGNVVKFDFNSVLFPDAWFAPKGKSYWENIQKEFGDRYGKDDHNVSIQIIKEIKAKNRILNLVDSMGFSNSVNVFKSNDYQVKILAYSDQRVSPNGIVSMSARHKEAKKRYASRIKSKYTPKQFLDLVNKYKEIEKQIFTHCSIKPNDITEKKVLPLIEKLKNYEIQTG